MVQPAARGSIRDLVAGCFLVLEPSFGGYAMEDTGRERRRSMLGELLGHMEDAREVAGGLARERPDYRAVAEAVRNAADMVSMACELEAYCEPESDD